MSNIPARCWRTAAVWPSAELLGASITRISRTDPRTCTAHQLSIVQTDSEQDSKLASGARPASCVPHVESAPAPRTSTYRASAGSPCSKMVSPNAYLRSSIMGAMSHSTLAGTPLKIGSCVSKATCKVEKLVEIGVEGKVCKGEGKRQGELGRRPSGGPYATACRRDVALVRAHEPTRALIKRW